MSLTAEIKFRCTPEEKAEIVKRAGGPKKVSGYLRRVGLGEIDYEGGVAGLRAAPVAPEPPGPELGAQPRRAKRTSGLSSGVDGPELSAEQEAQIEKEMKRLRGAIPQTYRRRAEAERIVRERSSAVRRRANLGG